MSKILKEIKKKKSNKAGKSLDNIIGREGNDTIHGNRRDNYLSGENGNDKLFGYAGNDILLGGNGNDKLFGGKGKDTIRGGSGNDYISGGNGKDNLYGNNGNDTIIGGKGNDKFVGGKGNDVIYTGKGKNTVVINNGDGHDTIYHQGEKTLIDIEGYNEFSGDISFNKKSNDLNIIYSHYDETKEIITIKDYFTSDGKTTSHGIYLKSEPVMAVSMYGIPPILIGPEETTYEMPLMKYAPPEYFNSDHTITNVETVDGFIVVAKYALPPLGEEIATVNSDYDSDYSPETGTSSPEESEIPVVNSEYEELDGITAYPEILKYGIPPIYASTREEIDLTTLLNINGITVNTDKPGKIYGTEYDDTINGSKGNDTIIAGNGNDKIYAKNGNDVINAGKGTNILYFSKNDGKNTVINGKGTDILIVKDDKFSNLKTKFSGNNLILKYTGGEIILKDYKKGNHSAKYIQLGEKRKAIEDILPAQKTSKNSDSKSIANTKANRSIISNTMGSIADTGLIKSEASEWAATNDTLSETMYSAEKAPDSINAILGTEDFNQKAGN